MMVLLLTLHGATLPNREFMKLLTKIVLAASLSFGATAVAQDETVDLSKTGTHYLNKFGLTVYVDSQHELLKDLTLKTALTDQGPIYYSEEKEIFFTQTLPMTIRSEQLSLVDLELFDYVAKNIPNTIDKVAENEKVVVTMFTDFTCGWCQKVHDEIDTYLAAGISFRFVLFPRNGLQRDQVANMMSTIVQSEDPYQTMQKVFKEQYIHSSPISPIIQNNFNVAMQLGVSSTPAFVINGYPHEGYMTPEQILKSFVENES